MFSNKSGKHFEVFWCPIKGWGTFFGASRVARATILDPMDQELPKSWKKQLFWIPFGVFLEPEICCFFDVVQNTFFEGLGPF